MKKFIALLIVIPTICFGQDISNSVGVVTLSEEYDKTDHNIEILNKNGSIWGSFNCYGPWDNLPELEILAFKPDYFLVKIKCQQETPTHYVIMVNEETGLIKTIKKSNKIKLVNWEQYILDVFSLSIDPSEQKVYDSINGKPISCFNPNKNTILVPKEIKGDWVRVIWTAGDYNYPSDAATEVQNGWIRWRVNGKIIVTVNHLS